MIDAGGIDAAAITTPPETRRELVLEAIDAGLHVVADKPFAPTVLSVQCEPVSIVPQQGGFRPPAGATRPVRRSGCL